MALSPTNSVYFFYGCVCLPVVDHMAAAPGRDSHQRCRYLFFCFSSFVGMICSDGFNLINFLNVLIENNGHKTFPNHQAKPTATHYVNQFATEKRVWWIQNGLDQLGCMLGFEKARNMSQTLTTSRKLLPTFFLFIKKKNMITMCLKRPDVVLLMQLWVLWRLLAPEQAVYCPPQGPTSITRCVSQNRPPSRLERYGANNHTGTCYETPPSPNSSLEISNAFRLSTTWVDVI